MRKEDPSQMIQLVQRSWGGATVCCTVVRKSGWLESVIRERTQKV